MGRTKMKRWCAGVALVGLLPLAGCSSESTINSDSTPKAGSQGTVTIAVYPWVGYEADVAVVSHILTTKLGYKVETKKMTAKESWPALESGTIDVVLENWAHAAEKKSYIDEKKAVVHLGNSGNKGVIGWYVPMWMAQQYPDIRDWNNLNKYASLFKTSATGAKGQLLDGDTSYTTNDPSLVANLKLNYQVTNSGSEDATVQAAIDASKNRTPLLFYFWEPHWLFRQQKFAKINLPAYTTGCDSDPAKVACDYEAYPLDKLGSKKFVDKGGKAVEFLKNFSWSNADQNELADYLVNEKLSPADAATRWMDAHPDTWQSWMP